MSHEVETMAYAGEVPWHGLGVPVSNDLTPTMMMEKAGLDWRVEEVPTYADWNGEKIPTGKKLLSEILMAKCLPLLVKIGILVKTKML